MLIKDKIVTFSRLGEFILKTSNIELIKDWARMARNQNAWFTEDNVLLSLKSIAEHYLKEENLNQFAKKYLITENKTPKKIGLVMAGNIPAVGFHDLICVILSDNIACIKLSSSDSILTNFLIQKLIEINPAIENFIQITERLNEVAALIATGSDNTAKHFEYYFANKPHIIRRNRTSIAILNGNETKIDLMNLGDDIFQYFGLGCRNVSKFYVPTGYKFDSFYEAIEPWNTILIHHKYQNNYDYNKSINLVNRSNFFDNGFLLIKEDDGIVSPISVIYFENYKNIEELKAKVNKNEAKTQCIVSKDAWYENSVTFGKAQSPNIYDFADNVDTMQFLSGI